MPAARTYTPLLKRIPDKMRVAHTTEDLHIPVPAIAPDKPMSATWFKPKEWSGATVLVICGAGDNRLSFKWLLFEKLLRNGLAVLTVDPPGHGDYMTVPSTVDNARKAPKAAAEWLLAQPEVKRIGVIGISFGGCQVATLAAEDARVAALCTIASPVTLPPVTQKVIATEAFRLLLPRNLWLLRSISPLDVWQEWKSIRGAWYGESLYDMIERMQLDKCVNAMGTRPVLVVHGAQDAAVPPTNAHKLNEVAGIDLDGDGKRDFELLLVPQATHLSVILQDKPMQRVANWMAEKLK